MNTLPFEKLVSFTKKVADLPDRPALNPSELKAQFDSAPDEVRRYLNQLIEALEKTTEGDSGAKNIGATPIPGIEGTNIQTILNNLGKQKSFIEAYQSAGQNVGSNTWTKVLYQTKVTDTKGEYDPSQSRFTAKENGKYFVFASVLSAIPTVDNVPAGMIVRVNNADHVRLCDTTLRVNKNTLMANSVPIRMNAGDYIEIFFQVGGMGTVSPNTASGPLNTVLRIQQLE